MRPRRLVEVFRGGSWIRINMSDVKSGEQFRMFEQSGERVRGEGSLSGETVFTADCDAYAVGNGRFGVHGRSV